MKKTMPKTELRYCDIPQSDYMVLVENVRIRNNQEDAVIPHFHNLLEVGFCLEGEGILQIRGQDFPYQPGTWSIVPENCTHDTCALHGTDSVWEYLFVDVVKLLEETYHNDPDFYDKVLERTRRKGFLFRPGEQETVYRIATGILRESREKQSFYRGVIRGGLLALVMEIARLESKETNLDGGWRTNSLVDQLLPAFFYVRENYSQPIRIRQLADACHMSESHFRRVFWEMTGMTPTDYLNLFRVRKACDLLYRKKASMEEVSHLVGFPTVSTFNRNFKQIMGKSPYQWKKHPTDYRKVMMEAESPRQEPQEEPGSGEEETV